MGDPDRGRWPTADKGAPLVTTDETGFSAIQTGLCTPPAAFPENPSHNRFDHDAYASWWTSEGGAQSAFIRLVHGTAAPASYRPRTRRTAPQLGAPSKPGSVVSRVWPVPSAFIT